MMLRIAHLGTKGIPSDGGTERVVEALAVRQAAAGHQVTVYGRQAVSRSGWYRGVRTVGVSTVRGKHAGPTVLGLKCALHAAMRGNYDIVHVHGFENGFELPIIGLRFPTVMTFHGRGPVGKWGRVAWALMHSMEPTSLRFASLVTSVSCFDAQQLAKEYGRPVAYVPNGAEVNGEVDSVAARGLLDRYGVPEGRFWLFCAARIVPSKGCLTLLQAYSRVPDAPPLVVVGDLSHVPEHAVELSSAAKDLNVYFVPLVSSHRVLLGLLEAANAFLFPSRSEGMSMMLLEALLYGGPIVATDIAANRDVTGRLATLLPVDDVGAWADALAGLRGVSDADVAALRRAGRCRAVGAFNWDKVTLEYDAHYRRVLSGRPTRV